MAVYPSSKSQYLSLRILHDTPLFCALHTDPTKKQWDYYSHFKQQLFYFASLPFLGACFFHCGRLRFLSLSLSLPLQIHLAHLKLCGSLFFLCMFRIYSRFRKCITNESIILQSSPPSSSIHQSSCI